MIVDAPCDSVAEDGENNRGWFYPLNCDCCHVGINGRWLPDGLCSHNGLSLHICYPHNGRSRSRLSRSLVRLNQKNCFRSWHHSVYGLLKKTTNPAFIWVFLSSSVHHHRHYHHRYHTKTTTITATTTTTIITTLTTTATAAIVTVTITTATIVTTTTTMHHNHAPQSPP